MRYVEAAKRVFMDTGTRFPRRVIWSVALIKREAASANTSFGKLDPKIASAIGKASTEVMQGKHDPKVVVDVFQTGSGTGLNMNVNELIAERASDMLRKDGSKRVAVHPNDHVNMGQSSNDVVPSAIRIAAVALCEADFRPGRAQLDSERHRARCLPALPRSQAHVLRAFHWPRRDRDTHPGRGGREQHHAREDEPGDRGGRDARVGSGHGPRPSQPGRRDVG